MPEIQKNNISPVSYTMGTPLYNYPYNIQSPQGSVAVSTPNSSQIYNYPQSSVYGDKSKQTASGVNIYIYNPSAIGGPTSNSTANATYTMPEANQNGQSGPIAQTPIQGEKNNNSVVPQQNMTIANTPISGETSEQKSDKTKNVVELTDSYIKTLESYIKSGDKKIRQNGIKELIKRFEEDDSRYDDPALTALLNTALLDNDPSNRILAMSVIAGGNAHGDENTVELLKQYTQSDKMYGQEALLASNALLKTAETRQQIPDNTADNKK